MRPGHFICDDILVIKCDRIIKGWLKVNLQWLFICDSTTLLFELHIQQIEEEFLDYSL